jgi:GNAT superfamily N-acetyltransferase
MQFIRKIKRNLRDHGLWRTLVKTLLELLHPVFHARTYRLYRADLRQVAIPDRPDPAFVFRLLTPGDVASVRQIEDLEEWLRGTLQQRLAQGAICLLALDGDRVAGFNLVTFTGIHIPVVHYLRRLRPGDAFSEQITVHPEYRGRGLGSTLRHEIFRILRQQGKRRLYGGTDAHNGPNLALCRKVGLKEVADVRYQKLLRRKLTTVRRIGR